MSDIGAAPRAAASLSPARAEASRKNGAKSKGPKTPEGKARSAQNALKHGLRAQQHLVLPGEDAAAFAALEAALLEELAPEGALQAVLARRIVAAAWRLERAERLEAELFEKHGAPVLGQHGPGIALIRDCNGPQAFDTLLRYRGTATAELWRALRTLKALQAERQAMAAHEMREAVRTARPDEPESRANPGDSGQPLEPPHAPGGNSALAWLPSWPFPTPPALAPGGPAGGPAPCIRPIEPETRGKPGSAPRPSRAGIAQESGDASLLAGTALVPPGRG